jgi:hypothetical protein
MSTRSAPLSERILAASARTSGSEPKIWTPRGRSAGDDLIKAKLLSIPRTSPSALTISVRQRAQPKGRTINRNGRSVIPAMGARQKQFFRTREPILSVFIDKNPIFLKNYP